MTRSPMKRTADALTASRIGIAVVILLLSLKGKSALEAVVLLTILGWTTDVLDGRLARRAQAEGGTWLADHEFACDMLMVYAGFAYLTLAGYVPVPFMLIYTLVAAAAVIWTRSKAVTEAFAAPLVALPLIIAYLEAPLVAYLYLTWIALALVLDWRRFSGVVSEFIDGMKRLRL